MSKQWVDYLTVMEMTGLSRSKVYELKGVVRRRFGGRLQWDSHDIARRLEENTTRPIDVAPKPSPRPNRKPSSAKQLQTFRHLNPTRAS